MFINLNSLHWHIKSTKRGRSRLIPLTVSVDSHCLLHNIDIIESVNLSIVTSKHNISSLGFVLRFGCLHRENHFPIPSLLILRIKQAEKPCPEENLIPPQPWSFLIRRRHSLKLSLPSLSMPARDSTATRLNQPIFGYAIGKPSFTWNLYSP